MVSVIFSLHFKWLPWRRRGGDGQLVAPAVFLKFVTEWSDSGNRLDLSCGFLLFSSYPEFDYFGVCVDSAGGQLLNPKGP
jgi:hypothetical protein